jgi:predicted DCC family thiol-disulfide oxidoreductase YuxK
MDRRQVLKFARLDSNFASSQNLKPNAEANSVIYLREESTNFFESNQPEKSMDPSKSTTNLHFVVYSESTAAAWILWDLGFPWRIFGGFLFLIPPFIRNRVYRFIAKNRYVWFGKSKTCWVMTPDLKTRFLD